MAGLKKYLKGKGRKGVIVSTLTGMGLKAVEKVEISGKFRNLRLQ